MATAMQGSPSQQGRRILLAGMRFLLGAVFLGYLMVWILSTTNLWWKNWNVQVDKHAKSTYFGEQGSTFLIFTFPILFIAALGCLYLHLGKTGGNYMERNGENSRLAFWKRPLLVKGPLGVVSAIELAFLAMFIALLIWTYSTRLTIRFSEINRGMYHHHNHDKRWKVKLRTSAYNLGLVGNICCAFLFFPVTRGSSILPLVGLTSEASIKYHIWLGHLAMVLFTAHSLCYFLYWAITHDLEQLLRWDKVGVSNVAGEIALVFGIVMWVAVLPRMRRQKFEFFFYTHQLYFLFLLFYVLHVGIAFFALILPGVYLFLIDRYLRFLQSRQKVRLVSTRLLPCETLELNFTKSPGLVYTPTSLVFVNVPTISSLQWHPFTVSSNCNLEPDNLSVIIKKEGTWSQKLYNMLSSPLDRLNVSVEGPYGPAAVDFQRHDTLVLVSGGSGITPFISIIRELIFISTTLTSPTPHIVLISAFKTSADLTMLDLLLPISATNSPISKLQFQLEAFVTREKEPPSTTDPQKLIQTIWFKPHPSDTPISPVLGPNGWLWLGAIISSSFVMYLILVGILTRYYIYPIDHNTGNTYSTSSKSLLNTLFICFCIAVTASVAMLWNKKSMEDIQNGSVEMDTPSTTFPSSWSQGSDGDVENVPRQSLVQSSKVHYGGRPPLKRMLLEIEGSSVGVLVSGPKEMRHDVATIDFGAKRYRYYSDVWKTSSLPAILLLLGMVFLGWLIIWILIPTNTFYEIWLPKLHAQTDSTYFGTQGTNLLLFTVPILLIAFVGCLYLHFGKKGDNDNKSYGNNRLLALWRRPVLVKGPLGIVSATELAFSAMFMALLVWSFSTYLCTGFSNIQLEKEGEQVWEAKLSSAALRLGLIGSVCCAFLFFPVTRGSSVLPLIGLTSEGSIKYHIWLGHIGMILFTAHGLCYIIYWAATNQISQMVTWDKIDVANVPGELALLSGLVMWSTSLPSIRRKMFEIFYYTHHLYSLFLFFFLLHVHISFFCLILPGVYLFLIDRYLRFLQSRRKVPLVSARILRCETIELNLSKSPGLSYGPLSIVFINVPSISSLQWHPFTVSSNSNMDQDHLSVIVKAEGSWSQKLFQMISSPSRVERMHVSVEGPYGPTSAHFLSHEMLVMVSGGSGITPFISIIRELIYRRTTSGRPSPRLLLICAFKNSSDLSMLDLLLPISGTNSAISLLQLRIEAFITREKEPPTDAPKSLQTIWFKPGNSDEPIYAVLGPSSWLWLGIIISTSFVMFLLLLGILTHYYIYPIDHNTDMVYSNLSRSLLNMLFICVSIFATSSVVELWNRKQRVMEAKQLIQNMEMEPTPTTSSPGSWSYSADRELESLPRQPLIEATITNVHYGSRPDLKKLILECQGSSIGVLASGPREMRHDVATICSSGLAHNLHFESISFSW